MCVGDVNPVLAMAVLDQLLQRDILGQVAPPIHHFGALLAGPSFAHEPTHVLCPFVIGPHAPDASELATEPITGSLSPTDRAPKRGLDVGNDVLSLPGCGLDLGRWGQLEVTPHANDVGQISGVQPGQKIRVVAVIGVGHDTRKADGQCDGVVNQVQGYLGLGLEFDELRDVSLLASLFVVGPGFGQVEPGPNRPSDCPLGVDAVDGDLTVSDFAKCSSVLASDADRRLALLGKAGVVDDQRAVAFGVHLEHRLDSLSVDVGVPGRVGEELLESLVER